MKAFRTTDANPKRRKKRQASVPVAPAAVMAPQTLLLGVPRPEWSLALIGTLIYTAAVVTQRLPAAGALAVAVALLGVLLSRKPIKVPRFLWMYFIYVAWATLGALVSPFSDVALQSSLGEAKLALALLAMCAALETQEQSAFYIYFFVVCFLFFPMRGTLTTYFGGLNNLYGRAIWNYIYSDPNDLAALSVLALGFTMSIAQSQRATRMAKLLAYGAVLTIITVIVLTKSRGGFVGLVMMFLFPAIKAVYRKPSRILVILLVIAIALKVIPTATLNRYAGLTKLTSTNTIAQADPEGSAAQRWEIQKTAWRIFSDHPIFGIGVGAYEPANAVYSPELGARAPHNTYLELAAETGLPGLALWLTLTIQVLKRPPRRKNDPRPPPYVANEWIVSAFIGYLFSAFVGTYGGLNFPFLILATIFCVDRNQENAPPLANNTPIPEQARSN